MTDLGNGEVKAATEGALLIKLDSGDEVWIPRSVIHEASELPEDADEGDGGEISVKTWWADKEGLG